jgi:hypothetical protein
LLRGPNFKDKQQFVPANPRIISLRGWPQILPVGCRWRRGWFHLGRRLKGFSQKVRFDSLPRAVHLGHALFRCFMIKSWQLMKAFLALQGDEICGGRRELPP